MICGAEASVAVMSGNFVQRGEAAVLSKWERAKIAVDCGIDLVLELPFIYAVNNAEIFAKGAVRILNGLNCVDYISFGSESGDLEDLTKTADVVSSESPGFKKAIKENLEKGLSFPKARALAVKEEAGEEAAGILDSPNNILAVEYLKQLKLTGSDIIPITVKRKGRGHNKSAAAIRDSLSETCSTEGLRAFVPDECFNYLKGIDIDFDKKTDNMFFMICAKILAERREEQEGILSAGEGLGNKLIKEIRGCRSMEELISRVKSKRYTRTRIQRLITHTLFGLTTEDFRRIEAEDLCYTRVLGFNDTGAGLLKKIKKSEPGIPVITNINKQVDDVKAVKAVLKYDIAAGDVYNLISGSDIGSGGDFSTAPYRKF